MPASVEEFLNELAGFFAAYLDSAGGYHLVLERLERAQKEITAATGKTIRELDQQAFTYTDGHPDAPSTKALVYGTQGIVKERNRPDGANSIFVARMLLVTTYQLWDEHFRPLIASALGKSTKDLKSDLFGDLRRYRQSIVHNRSIATSEVGSNKVLKWFGPGQSIDPTQQQMRDLMFMLRDELVRMEPPKPAV